MKPKTNWFIKMTILNEFFFHYVLIASSFLYCSPPIIFYFVVLYLHLTFTQTVVGAVARVQWARSSGAAGLHRNSWRENREAACFLPGPPHHWQNRHHQQPWENGEWNQGSGAAAGTQRQHAGSVRKTGNFWKKLIIIIINLKKK